MKRRITVVLAVVAGTLTMTGTALAFDCMRVSTSMQGLQRSAANGGHWLFFDMTQNGGGVAEVANFLFGPPSNPSNPPPPLTPAQVACFQSAYTAAQASDPTLPTYWALGAGVAGGNTNGPAVLAHNNPNSNVLSNGTGIDHFDATIMPVFEAAAPTALACT